MSRIPIRSILPLAVLLAACTEQAEVTGISQLDERALSSATVSVVMSNLNSPRGLGWGPEGALYAVPGEASML